MPDGVSKAQKIVPIPAFADNYIWAMVAAHQCVVVDPGDAAPVLEFLAAHELALHAILVTHHHADHVGGVAELTTRWQVPVYGPAAENIARVSHTLREGDSVALPQFVDQPFRVMEVPGHTRGHIAYVSGDILFCGDTLFAAGCGRLFEGTAAQLHHSLTRLAALPGNTRVFCTHEYTLANLRFALHVDADNSDLLARNFVEYERRAQGEPTLPSTIALERATNPFLRCATRPIADAARAHLAQSQTAPANLLLATQSDEVNVFALLRQWKNEFRG
jgi:hydroxyacylglutathione hydrolase